MAKTVLCLGHITADRVFDVAAMPAAPGKYRAGELAFAPGGMAANAAVAIARLGGRAVFCGRVGDDATGAAVLAALAEQGVDTSLVRVAAGGRTSESAVIVARDGERMIVNFRGSGLAEDAAWLAPAHLAAASVVLADVRWVEGAARVFALARELGVPSVLDADAADAATLRRLVGLADHAVFSAPGLADFAAGCAVGDALAQALADGAKLAAVTRGEHGVEWMRRGEREPRHLAAFAVPAVDTLGAGDVFHGAYALALAEGRDPPDALRFGAAAAALKCTRKGLGDAVPTRGEADRLSSAHA
jgi:sulfofructose kinase